MSEYADQSYLFLLTLLIFLLPVLLYLSMDIHNASKTLWSACGNLKGKMKPAQPFKRRASDSDFQLLNSGDDTSVPGTPEPRDGWSLISDHRNNFGSADDLSRGVDCGHFTEEEFLARFGGMRSLPFSLPLLLQLRHNYHTLSLQFGKEFLIPHGHFRLFELAFPNLPQRLTPLQNSKARSAFWLG